MRGWWNRTKHQKIKYHRIAIESTCGVSKKNQELLLSCPFWVFKARMINLNDFKRSLGASASQMTEAEILTLRDLQDRMAELLFSLWKEKVSQQKD